MSEAMAAEIGDDVYSDVEVNFIRAIARKDSSGNIIGTEIQNVIAQNPNGSMPRFLVDQMTKHQSSTIIRITDYVKKNKAAQSK